MSRLSDLLNPAPLSTSQTQELDTSRDGRSRAKSHQRNQSITSPLEALAIAATSSYAEPSLMRTSHPSTFFSNSGQSQLHQSKTLSITENPLYHVQSTEAPMQPISYSLYNQPTPPKMQWQASTNGTFNENYAPNSQHNSEKMATVISVDDQKQQDAEPVKSGPNHVEEVNKTQTGQDDPELMNNASSRDEEVLPHPEEKQTAPKDEAQPQEVVTDAIKQEVQTPPIGAPSPVTASSPSKTTPKSAKPRSTPKPEKKKVNNNIAKKPAAKKRKIEVDSRGDTPVSHRSATPTSNNASKASAQKSSKQNSATPAQSSPPPAEEEEADEDDSASDNELFCICRKPDDHTWMIGCDGGCEDWFHGRCVNLQQKQESLIDKYICKRFEPKSMVSTNVS